MNLRWSDDAIADLDQIDRYISRFDPGAADRVLAAIGRAAERLMDFPNSGRAFRRGGYRKLSVPRYRYSIYYRVDDPVLILRVIHMRRRPR